MLVKIMGFLLSLWFPICPKFMFPLSHDLLQNHSCVIEILFSSALVGCQLALGEETCCATHRRHVVQQQSPCRLWNMVGNSFKSKSSCPQIKPSTDVTGVSVSFGSTALDCE